MESPSIALSVRPGEMAVSRMGPADPWPDWALRSSFVTLTRTEGELSIVCPDDLVPDEIRAERGWRALQVAGPLDFGLTGILAGLTATLAKADIAVLAISTFDTDMLLVRSGRLPDAIAALRSDGYEVTGEL